MLFNSISYTESTIVKKIGKMNDINGKSFCFFRESVYIFLSAVDNGDTVVSMLSDRSFNMQKTCPVLPQGKGENSPFCPVFGLLWSKWNSVLYCVKVAEWQRVAMLFEQV